MFGILLLIEGVIELVRSFGHSVANRALSVIIGVLGIVIGIVLIRHPFTGVSAIGLLIGIWLVVVGMIRLVQVLAFGPHRFLRGALAIVEVIVGIVIVSDPHIGYTALAIIAGIWLIISGFGAIALGILMHGVKSDLSTPAEAAAN